MDTLAGWGIDISGVIEEQILKPENVVGWASAALSALVGALKSVSLIVFIVAYMLVEVSGFRKRFYEALGEDRPALRRWLQWTRETRSYLWITTVLAVLVAVLNFALLWALGVPYPFTWAFLSFVMSYIPNVGFLIALVPPLTLAILQRSWGMVIGVLVGYVVINFMSDNIFKPRFLKSGMDLPAAVSFLSVLIWGFVLGPIGALLSHTHDHDGQDDTSRSLARDRAARPAAAIRRRSCADQETGMVMVAERQGLGPDTRCLTLTLAGRGCCRVFTLSDSWPRRLAAGTLRPWRPASLDSVRRPAEPPSDR